VDEPATGSSYLVCVECGHRYRTKRELRAADRAALRKDWRFPSYRPRLIPTWSNQSIWGWVRRYLTVRAGKIYACPFCTADF
jgi:hypothetical protein